MRDVTRAVSVMLAVGAFLLPGSAEAQGPGTPAQAPGAEARDLTLVYDREVFTYLGQERRDPFRPLTSQSDMGPRFEALSLQGIIYSTGRGRSVALLNDSEGRVYRVRVGDLVGPSRVIEIGPSRVVLAVDNFGTIRQEILELPTKEGTDR